MLQNRFSPKLIAGVIVALFFGVALYFRIVPPYDQVFIGDQIKFIAFDPYYHMRIVDNLAHNFPHLNPFDPYMLYPSGMWFGSFPFFDYLLAGIIWLIGLGSPTQQTVDIVGVYFPAVLGALTVIPVYFIGKELFNRWAGVIAAGLVGLYPGEFLHRSIIGFTDYHVAETLFTTLAILFLILAVKTGRHRQLSFHHIKRRDWAVVAKPIFYSLLAGIFLGIYFLTWMGALLFVFIIFLYFIVQFIIDHLRGGPTNYLCFVSTVIFSIALLMLLPTSPDKLHLAALGIAIFTPIGLAVISQFLKVRGIKPIFYPVILLELGLASLALLHIPDPLLLRSIVGTLQGFFSWPIETTVSEMQPLLFPGGDFSLSSAWNTFTTGFFLSLISLGILIYLVIKRGEAEKTLLVVWSLVILAATLAMWRFGYYFTINVALLTG
ncbi:MAG: STT3 domain-containing protein, partial [Dehalococcoidales bacterium]